MTKQLISLGTSANDGTGDTLRDAGTKLNANFTELYGLVPGGEAQLISGSSVVALNTADNVYLFSMSSTPAGNFTLSDGSIVGETKRVMNKSGSSVSISINIGASGLADGNTGLTLTDNVFFDLAWDGTNWHWDRTADSRVTTF
jgi:hypothetical protein